MCVWEWRGDEGRATSPLSSPLHSVVPLLIHVFKFGLFRVRVGHYFAPGVDGAREDVCHPSLAKRRVEGWFLEVGPRGVLAPLETLLPSCQVAGAEWASARRVWGGGGNSIVEPTGVEVGTEKGGDGGRGWG